MHFEAWTRHDIYWCWYDPFNANVENHLIKLMQLVYFHQHLYWGGPEPQLCKWSSWVASACTAVCKNRSWLVNVPFIWDECQQLLLVLSDITRRGQANVSVRCGRPGWSQGFQESMRNAISLLECRLLSLRRSGRCSGCLGKRLLSSAWWRVRREHTGLTSTIPEPSESEIGNRDETQEICVHLHVMCMWVCVCVCVRASYRQTPTKNPWTGTNHQAPDPASWASHWSQTWRPVRSPCREPSDASE